MKELYKLRRNKLKQTLKENEVIVLFSGEKKQRSGDQFFPFCVDRNFFYLTGIDEDNCILVLTKTNEVLYVNKQEEVQNNRH